MNHSLQLLVLILILTFLNPTMEQEGNRVKRSIQTAGYGCDILKPSLLREPIPGTNLNTGTFYIFRMKAIVHVKSELAFGYVTWSGKHHPSGFQYVYADSHHNMEKYTEGATWYKDGQWAFLKSREAGWYHFINCGYPFKYATWSNMEEEDDESGALPMTLDANYPGNHSKSDFLFKPVAVKGERAFHLLTKSFGEGIVSMSQTNYVGESNYMQVESTSTWKDRVNKKGKQEEENALFIIENSQGEDVTFPIYIPFKSYDNRDNCFYRERILFAGLLVFLALVTLYWALSRKSVLFNNVTR